MRLSWEDEYLLFIWCFFYGVITQYALSGTILFSLVDSYLITFKIGNVAKYCTIPPPSHSLDNGGKSPREQFIKHCFLPTYFILFLLFWRSSTGGGEGRGAPPERACPLKKSCPFKFKILQPPRKKKRPFLKIPLETCSFD